MILLTGKSLGPPKVSPMTKFMGVTFLSLAPVEWFSLLECWTHSLSCKTRRNVIYFLNIIMLDDFSTARIILHTPSASSELQPRTIPHEEEIWLVQKNIIHFQSLSASTVIKYQLAVLNGMKYWSYYIHITQNKRKMQFVICFQNRISLQDYNRYEGCRISTCSWKEKTFLSVKFILLF